MQHAQGVILSGEAAANRRTDTAKICRVAGPALTIWKVGRGVIVPTLSKMGTPGQPASIARERLARPTGVAKDRTMKQESGGLRAVIFQDGDVWVAQCLEYDIGAQAQDLDTVRRRLAVAIEIERQTSLEIHGKDFAGIDEAPAHFFEMWEKRSKSNKQSKARNRGEPFGVELALCA
jgi:hypothetical protein